MNCAQLLLRGYETEGAADAADSEVEVWLNQDFIIMDHVSMLIYR